MVDAIPDKDSHRTLRRDHILIKIPTELYEETTSTETAAGNLRAIGQLVLDSGVLEKRKGLQLQQRDDVVSIHSSRGRMYVRFSISECR